jgi:enoyl-CoA hydratase
MGAVKIEDAGGCTWLRLSTGASNALTIDVVGELASALDRAVGLGKGVVLCGSERFFCNGLDLAWALSRSPDEMRGMFLALGDLVLKMLECPVPLVGAIKRHAIGAGKTLFTACDYRYAATGRVLIGMPEILLGVPNPYFADQIVRHIAGDVVASDLIYSGRMIEAERCVASGIVHHVFDREAVEEEGRRKAVELSALPRQAFVAAKTMRGARLCHRIRAGIAEHTDRLVEMWYGAEAQARLHAAARRLAG